MANMMSCQYCFKKVTPQGLKNHERNCAKNPSITEAGETDEVIVEEVNEEEIPNLEVEIAEEVSEIEEVKVLNDDVEIVTNQNLRTYIGDRNYTFVKGAPQKVNLNVKDILKRAGMLGAN